MQNSFSTHTVIAAAFAGAAVTLAVMAFTPHSANALPAYAARTGLPCGQCHIDPHGGGPRNAFGRAFARNGHHLPGKGRRASPGRPSGDGYDHPGYGGYGGYGPGMMGGYGGGMGPGMMGGYGR